MTEKHPLQLGNHIWNPGDPLFLYAGPCVIEDERMAMFTAEQLKKICDRLNVLLVFKASYDQSQ